MKHLVLAILVSAFAVPLAWSALAQEVSPATTPPTFEYKVVPMSEIHGRTLAYLKEAPSESKGGILGLFKSLDDQLAKKTEDHLNELGAEGWELLHKSNTSLILMRATR